VKFSITNASLLALSIILSLAALETALHIYFYATEGYWLFRGQDNFTVPFAKLVPDDRVYTLRPNSTYEGATIGPLGFRESPPVPLDRRTICVLGDSVPFGAGVGDNETVPFHLKRLLEEARYRVGVLNAAVPSYTWNQSFLRWRYDVEPRYDCKLFVISAANDATLMLYYMGKWTPKSTWAERNLNMRPAHSSAVRYYVERAVAELLSNPNDKNYLLTDLPAFERNTQAILERLSEVAPVIVLPITACYYTDRPLADPTNLASCDHYKDYKANAEEWGNAVNGVNERLRSLRGLKNVIFLDTAKILDVDRAGLFADGMHFSDKGARLIARSIMKAINDKPKLDDAIRN
jgi:hypothetical protein